MLIPLYCCLVQGQIILPVNIQILIYRLTVKVNWIRVKLLKFKDFIDDFPTLYGIDLMGMNIANVQLKKKIEFNNRIL
jgi:hypothetical protein